MIQVYLKQIGNNARISKNTVMVIPITENDVCPPINLTDVLNRLLL